MRAGQGEGDAHPVRLVERGSGGAVVRGGEGCVRRLGGVGAYICQEVVEGAARAGEDDAFVALVQDGGQIDCGFLPFGVLIEPGEAEHVVDEHAGLANIARVITCGALIMTSVLSVIVDAAVVRLLLVPATMYLLGRANRWIPDWLDRLLPHLDPDGDDAG